MLKNILKDVILSLESDNVPSSVIAWHIDLAEPYCMDLVGSSEYNTDDNGDWACPKNDDFYPTLSYVELDFLNDMSWEEVLEMFIVALRELKTEMMDAKIFKYKALAVGFVDGDLILV